MESFDMTDFENCVRSSLDDALTKLHPFRADFVKCIKRKRDNKEEM